MDDLIPLHGRSGGQKGYRPWTRAGLGVRRGLTRQRPPGAAASRRAQRRDRRWCRDLIDLRLAVRAPVALVGPRVLDRPELDPLPMDARLFRPERMGLEASLLGRPLADRFTLDSARAMLFIDFAGYRVRAPEQVEAVRARLGGCSHG